VVRANDEAITTAIIAVVDSDDVTGLCGVERGTWKIQSDVVSDRRKRSERGGTSRTHDDVVGHDEAVVVAAAVGCRCVWCLVRKADGWEFVVGVCVKEGKEWDSLGGFYRARPGEIIK
jgi:hypothetical protein